VAGDPTVVLFHRGWWCPKEQAFLRMLVRLQDEIEVAYTRLVSVSVDPPEVSAAFRAGLGARWTFLSDSERRYLDELGLRETTDTLHHPYLPTAFAVLPDRSIQAVWNGYWFWGRPTAEELRAAFRQMSMAVRPDWTPA
jgi:peroxiredoxin